MPMRKILSYGGLCTKSAAGAEIPLLGRGGVARSAGVVLIKKLILLNEPPAASRQPSLTKEGNSLCRGVFVQSPYGATG